MRAKYPGWSPPPADLAPALRSRLATTWQHGIYAKEQYGPFGEPYQEAAQDRSFTGQDQDTASGVYDFAFRKLDAIAGRWLSPDPAGWTAVDMTNPQSLNRYAYVLNSPLNAIDRYGLDLSCTGGYMVYGNPSDPGGGGAAYTRYTCTDSVDVYAQEDPCYEDASCLGPTSNQSPNLSTRAPGLSAGGC